MKWLIVLLILFNPSPTAESERRLEYEKTMEVTYQKLQVDTTWFTSTVQECDSTPFITADGTRVRNGILAVSVDLLNTFDYGDSVYIEDLGWFTIHDRMNGRWKKRIDIWCEDTHTALQNGIQRKEIRWDFQEEIRYVH